MTGWSVWSDCGWLTGIGVALLVAGFSASATAAPISLYVSTKGNDGWTGRRQEAKAPDGPFATLERAREELRQLKAAGDLTEGATVYVLPGTYYLSETLALGADDSGTEEAPIVYRSREPGRAVLCGGKVITGFRPHRDGILQCDMRANGLAGRRFRQLFFRGERQILARYPNLNPTDPHGGEWAHVAAVEGKENRTEFMYGSDEEHEWAHPEEGEVPIFGGRDWAFRIVPIARHIPEQRKIVLGSRTWGALAIGDRYIIWGLFEELDAPGEWYLNPRTDTLYFWPPSDISEGEVVVPVVDTIVSMENAEGITLRGFVIEACEGDAVRVIDSRHCIVAGNIVRNCGGTGIVISGGQHSGARGNDVYWCGHRGISVSGGDRKTLTAGHNFADNNYIHHCANIWLTYRPAASVTGVGNTVSHNLIHDMPHAGMLLSGNENVVEYNIVHHVNLQSADTGGIYFCSRDWTQRGNIIRHNIFHHCGGFGKTNSWVPVSKGKVEFGYPHFTWGIYLDDPTTGTLVYGNIVYGAPICATHNHGGRDNTWENNILVDSPAFRAGMLAPNWSEWPSIYQKLKAARYPGSPYLERYPEIADIADTRPEEMSGLRFVRNIVYYTKEGSEWLRRARGGSAGDTRQQLYSMRMTREDFERNEWDGNCIYAEPGIELRIDLSMSPEPRKQLTWDEWRELGADAHSITEDPLFVDPKNHDYRLKPDSPALRLGFKPIPVDKIGPYQDELRASWPIKEAPGAAALGDFVTVRHYEPPQYRRLEAREFTARDGAPNFFGKAAAGKPLKVAYFGGGIHPGSGWRKAVIEWLKERYGDVTEINASITDAVRGSGFSVYRFAHDVLAHEPDLVLIDFASDDHATDPAAIQRHIEGVVRQARHADPELDLIVLLAFRQGFEKDYAEGLAPYAVSAYERVAEHYGIPTVNMGHRVAQLYQQEKLVIRGSPEATEPPEKLVFSSDGVRPAPDGNEVYADVITAALEKLSAQVRPTPHKLPAPYTPDNYERAQLVPITREMLSGEWRELPADDPLRRSLSRHMDTIWFTNTPGAKLTLKFKGTAASVFDLMGPDTGRARITVDGNEIAIREQVDRWAYYQRLSALRIADGLSDTVHTVTVELLPDPPDRTVAIEAAKVEGRYDPKLFDGVAFRFGWIRMRGDVVPD